MRTRVRLPSLPRQTTVSDGWCGLRAQRSSATPPPRRFDWIVSNPPVHAGAADDLTGAAHSYFHVHAYQYEYVCALVTASASALESNSQNCSLLKNILFGLKIHSLDLL